MRMYLGLIVLTLALACPALPQAQSLSNSGIRTLEAVDKEEVDRRRDLLAKITDESRITRRIAVAELSGGFSNDPDLVQELLTMLEPQVSAKRPTLRLSEEARINILFLLEGAEESAWTTSTVTAARRILGTYLDAGNFVVGPQERALLRALEVRVEGLTLPQLAYGEIQGRIEGKTQFTDVDVFVCDYASADAPLVFSARTFARKLAAADFGRVRLRVASAELAQQVKAEPAHSTVVLDTGHPEEKQAKILMEMLQASSGLPDSVISPNTGEPSYWYLSVFVCP